MDAIIDICIELARSFEVGVSGLLNGWIFPEPQME